MWVCLMKSDCLRSRWISGGCSVCGRDMGLVAHLDLLATTAPTCPRCCAHCSPPEAQGAIVGGKVMVTHADDERRQV